jgi:hypothetical protein
VTARTANPVKEYPIKTRGPNKGKKSTGEEKKVAAEEDVIELD